MSAQAVLNLSNQTCHYSGETLKTPWMNSGFYLMDAFRPADETGISMVCAGDGRFAGTQALSWTFQTYDGYLGKDAGAAFSISSIDLAPMVLGQDVLVEFTGLKRRGGTVYQSFIVPNSFAPFVFATYQFDASFTDLGFLTFHAVSGGGYLNYQFTNIAVDQVATVPEPSSLALFLTGAAGLLARRVRSRRG